LGFKIEYKSSVIKDLKNLGRKAAIRITEPLSSQFKGLFSYHVGDSRVIYAKTRKGILILRIAHRIAYRSKASK